MTSLFSRNRHPGRRAIDRAGNFTTLIGQGSRFCGRIEGGENYLINGAVEGDCDISGTIVVNEQGRWTGNIHAANVIISGEVTGDISVTDKLELTATARVNGCISSPVIAIAEGAIHQGEIRMAREGEAKGEVTRFREQRETAS